MLDSPRLPDSAVIFTMNRGQFVAHHQQFPGKNGKSVLLRVNIAETNAATSGLSRSQCTL
jgi:hypothetical protein